jgi:hypothetical protein
LDHIHETNAQKLERQILRTACKRKAVDMMSERPSKIINSELFKMDEENLEKKDLKYVPIFKIKVESLAAVIE